MYINKSEAIQKLKEGDNVVLPTETVYGLAGRYDSNKAIQSIFEIKKRPAFDPLICHISNLEMLNLLVSEIEGIVFSLAKDFWPGPLTMILPKAANVSNQITADLDTVAIRMPKHPLCLEIIEKVAVPLCAPSANFFGKTSPTTAQDVEEEFHSKLPIVDGGPCEIGIESTIVTIENQKIKILRPGQITKEMLLKKGYELIDSSSYQEGPGSMPDHYQPASPFYLVKKDKLQKIENWQNLEKLNLENEASEAAKNLYQNLRKYSQKRKQGFYTFYEPERGNEWEAIWDRLKKASTRKDLLG